MLLFSMRGVAPKPISTPQIFRAVTPYVIMGVIVLVLVRLLPGIAARLLRRLRS